MPRLTLPLLASVLALAAFGAPAASAADCAGADLVPTSTNVVEARAAVVCLTNAERASAGLPALVPEGRLEAAAQAFSSRMVLERFFEHVSPDGGTLTGRLTNYAGWRLIGENIAWGEGTLSTPRKTVEGWMNSAGHRANILTPDFTEIGVGVAPGTPSSSRPGATWTQDFGVRREGSAPAPVQGVPAATAPVAAPAPAGTAKSVKAKKKPAAKCRRGTVRRISKSRGKRVVRCAAAKRTRR